MTSKRTMNDGFPISKNGSILLSIMIFTALISATIGGFLALSSQHFRMSQRKVDSEQAFYLAEAGLEAAAEFIMDRGYALPSSHSESNSIGNGSFVYHITKGQKLGTCDVLSSGEVNGHTRSIKLANVRASTYAEFAFWVEENKSIYFKDGERFWGRIHTDSTPWFTGDPIFHDLFTTLASGYEGSIKQVDFQKGFKTKTPMGDMALVDFVGMKKLAENYPQDGLLLTGESDIRFQNGQLLITNEHREWEDEPYPLDKAKLIYVQNGTITASETYTERVKYIKGYDKKGNPRYGWRDEERTRLVTKNVAGSATLEGGVLDGEITLVAEKDIHIEGHVRYAIDPTDEDAVDAAVAAARQEARDAGATELEIKKITKSTVVNDALGLISGANVVVTSKAPNDLILQASIMATGKLSSDSGSFYVHNAHKGDPRGHINLLGGVIQEVRGVVGYFETSSGKPISGFDKNYKYDVRFGGSPPPFFPPLNTQLSYESWEEVTAQR